jgi:hypothetical protein
MVRLSIIFHVYYFGMEGTPELSAGFPEDYGWGGGKIKEAYVTALFVARSS